MTHIVLCGGKQARYCMASMTSVLEMKRMGTLILFNSTEE
jgi:hypothetical protein